MSSVLHAFADESARGERYFVCAAVVAEADVATVRQLARSFCASRQRRWHFTKERDSRRRQILAALTGCGLVTAWVGYGKGDEITVRSECFKAMGTDLLEMGADRLVIESRQGRDHLDRRALFDVLPKECGMAYDHLLPHEDAGLWVADAIAWSYGIGGVWRERVDPIVTHAVDVGRA